MSSHIPKSGYSGYASGKVKRITGASAELKSNLDKAPTRTMKIPLSTLSRTTLTEVVEEFVTRDGTDHSTIKKRVTDVLKQLENGTVELHFDSKTGTCNIVAALV